MDDYEDENILENVDDEDEEMVNEDYKEGHHDENSKNDPNEKGLNPPHITIKPPGTKQKRRSKNDSNGRDYVCGCGKTYLSYPALYTHIKTKHNGKTPDGTNANQVQNGKGRGRPRKNFLINEDILKRREIRVDSGLDEKYELKELMKKDGKTNNLDEKEETYFKIYDKLGLIGAVSNPINGFPTNSNNNTNANNLTIEVKRGYQVSYNKLKFIWENKLYEKFISGAKHMVVGNNYLNSFKITCDDIFALFLIYISRNVNIKFYKTIVIFMKLYRDCMNKIGWEILSEYKDLSGEPTELDYTSVKNGEHLPEIANDFVNSYLKLHLPSFDKHLAVVILNHFSDWLFKYNFSTIRLKYSKEVDKVITSSNLIC
jgi:hypothetical protein